MLALSKFSYALAMFGGKHFFAFPLSRATAIELNYIASTELHSDHDY